LPAPAIPHDRRVRHTLWKVFLIFWKIRNLSCSRVLSLNLN